jgi:hypothetical protein
MAIAACVACGCATARAKGAPTTPSALPPLDPVAQPWPGTIVHHEATPAGEPIRALWTIAADDVWAIGGEHTVMHWDGHLWSLASPAHMDDAAPVAIWASGHDDVWLAATHPGYDSPPGGDLIEHRAPVTELQHWDGHAWRVVRTPDIGEHVVTQIHGSRATDVWFVTGATSVEARHPNPIAVLLHWDGAQLKRVQFVGADTLDDVWARAPNDAWATSFHAVWHWDGSDWTVDRATAQAGGAASTLDHPRAVWGDAGHVYVVLPSGAVLQRGATWTQVAPPVVAGTNRVSGIWRGAAETIRTGTGVFRWRDGHWVPLALPALDVQAATDAWVMGTHDGARATAHDDGGTWSLLDEPTSDTIGRMSFARSDDGWAIAASETRAALLHWDGHAWQRAATQPPIAKPHAVLAIDAQHVWVASDTELARWDGARWQVTPSAGAIELGSLWASGPDDVWAGGCGGAVLHWTGTSWRPQRVDVPKSSVGVCMALGGSGPTDVWAVGILSNYFHWDGKAWTRVRLDLQSERASGVWATAPDDVWFVGGPSSVAGPLLEHFDGHAWTHVAVDRGMPALLRIWGRAANDLWATGERGTVLHFDGTRWARIAIDAGIGDDDRALWAVGGGRTGAVWVGGANGELVSLTP